jgi:hypothetical protein
MNEPVILSRENGEGPALHVPRSSAAAPESIDD